MVRGEAGIYFVGISLGGLAYCVCPLVISPFFYIYSRSCKRLDFVISGVLIGAVDEGEDERVDEIHSLDRFPFQMNRVLKQNGCVRASSTDLFIFK